MTKKKDTRWLAADNQQYAEREGAQQAKESMTVAFGFSCVLKKETKH